MPSLRNRYVQDRKSKITFLEILQDLKKLQEIKTPILSGFLLFIRSMGLYIHNYDRWHPSILAYHPLTHGSSDIPVHEQQFYPRYSYNFYNKKACAFRTDFFVKPFLWFWRFPVTETLLFFLSRK